MKTNVKWIIFIGYMTRIALFIMMRRCSDFLKTKFCVGAARQLLVTLFYFSRYYRSAYFFVKVV